MSEEKLEQDIRRIRAGYEREAGSLHRQLSQAKEALAEKQKENKRLRKIAMRVGDDGLAGRVATDCHDPSHDDRWCPTCEARGDGIEAFQFAVLHPDKAAAKENSNGR